MNLFRLSNKVSSYEKLISKSGVHFNDLITLTTLDGTKVFLTKAKYVCLKIGLNFNHDSIPYLLLYVHCTEFESSRHTGFPYLIQYHAKLASWNLV